MIKCIYISSGARLGREKEIWNFTREKYILAPRPHTFQKYVYPPTPKYLQAPLQISLEI